MFDQYPKTRPPFPKEIAEIYSTYYKANREGKTFATSLSRSMEAWLHKQIAQDVLTDPSPRSTLEIGAGTLNQLPYEPEVGPYDIVEPFKELHEDSSLLGRVRNTYAFVSEIPAGQTYDRITSAATFEHICDLPQVMARAGLLLTPNGQLRVAIPSEGTPLWTLGWKLTTGLEFRIKYGLDYGLLMKHEHVNTATEIEQLLRFFFKKVDRKVFGLNRVLSLYQFYACKEPDLGLCSKLVE